MKNPSGPRSSRKRKLIVWAFALLLLYAIVGFLILPPIIRVIAVKQLSGQLDRKVSIQKVKLNPFVPSLTIRGLLILDKDGQPFVSWDEVYVNFQLSSIFTKTLTFREISVTRPFARAQMNKDYTFNFSDLVAKFSPTNHLSVPPKPSKPLFLRVKHLNITGASLSVADYTVRTPFKRVIGPLDFSLENFRTQPDANSPYSFAGITDAGENFAWRGYICLTPLRSEGELTVDDITLNKFAPLYQDLVSFKIRSGQIGVHAHYHFELSPSHRITVVTNAAFALRQFRLAGPDGTNDLADVFHFSVTGASADLESHRIDVDRVAGSGARLFLQRDPDKAINVVEASRPSETNANESGAVLLLLRSLTNAVAMLLNTTNQWAGALHEVAFTNCALQLRDYAPSRPAKLDLDDISLEAKNLSNVPNTNLAATLSLRWNTEGKINLSTTASLQPLSADVHLALDNLNLNTLDPYLESAVNILIPSASFGLNGDVHVRASSGELPAITFSGDTWLNDFRAVDGATAGDLLKWKSVRVSGIQANLNPPAVSIKEISLDGVNACIIIETNHAINLLSALHPAGTNQIAQAKPASLGKNSASSGVTNALVLPQISIASIVATNTQISFADRSINPNVNLSIEHAGGTIRGISTEELQHADVDLYALVDGVGPVKVIGHVNPFSGSQTNQIKILLTSMDLLPTSPYSGKFAGYRIARGNLNLDLEYDLVGRKLKSQNIITLDQFTFGEKVESPDATKLPVRLAIAILKDRQGKIVLNVPIEGSLDDPKFRIGKVVTRALLNILTRVATSPFSLIGAAFGGGGEELSYQDFAPGSAELSDASKRKLDVLAKALYARPGLHLEISGSVDPAGDRAGLQRAAFEKELRTRAWMSLRRSKRALTTPDAMVLSPEQRNRLVEKLYQEALAAGTITPQLIAANTNLAALALNIKSPPKNLKLALLLMKKSNPGVEKSPAAAPSSSRLPPLANPEEELLVDLLPVSAGDLETLAIERARTVRAYILLGGKVEPGRLFLAQNQAGGLRQEGARAYLQLN